MLILAGALTTTGISCEKAGPQGPVARKEGPRRGVTEVEVGAGAGPSAIGQTVYVPAYSAIATSDNLRLYQLAVTLCIRNTDRARPIVVTSVRYHDQATIMASDFPPGFILVGLIATSSALIFWRMPADAGAEMANRLPAAGRASDPKGG